MVRFLEKRLGAVDWFREDELTLIGNNFKFSDGRSAFHSHPVQGYFIRGSNYLFRDMRAIAESFTCAPDGIG